MADIATVGDTTITTETLKGSMDGKSLQFMTDDAINTVGNMVWAYINGKTKVSEYAEGLVTSAFYAMANWQLYMIYVESISEYIEGQSPRLIDDRIDRLKAVAELYLNAINITLMPKQLLYKPPPSAILTDTKEEEENVRYSGTSI